MTNSAAPWPAAKWSFRRSTPVLGGQRAAYAPRAAHIRRALWLLPSGPPAPELRPLRSSQVGGAGPAGHLAKRAGCRGPGHGVGAGAARPADRRGGGHHQPACAALRCLCRLHMAVWLLGLRWPSCPAHPWSALNSCHLSARRRRCRGDDGGVGSRDWPPAAQRDRVAG